MHKTCVPSFLLEKMGLEILPNLLQFCQVINKKIDIDFSSHLNIIVIYIFLILVSFLDWLQNGEDHPLKVTAALCIGNLCCSKENCQKVIQDFAPALIQALQNHQAPLIRDVKLQHAILSALKNLTVDPEGRKFLIKAGILQPCLELSAGLSLTPITQPVVMKLLATFR